MNILDLTPWRCPEPLIRLKLWLRQAHAGDRLTIYLSDPPSWPDLLCYLRQQGHQIEQQQTQQQTLILSMVVGGQNIPCNPLVAQKENLC